MRELIYWYQSGVLFTLDGLTLLQRNVLGMIAGTEKRGLLLHNNEIAHQFIVSTHAVKDALKILAEKDYITITKGGSPHRKIFSSHKTKQIIQQALRKAKSDKETPGSTGYPNEPVEKPTSYPSGPVTGSDGYPVPGQFNSQCIISKEVNQVIDGAKAPVRGESFSASVSHGSSPRKTRAPFMPPTVAQVQDYARQVGHTLLAAHPEKFVRHYEAAVPPWTKANGKPVKNWKQTLLNWRDNGQDSTKPKKSPEWPDPTIEEVDAMFQRAAEVEGMA